MNVRRTTSTAAAALALIVAASGCSSKGTADSLSREAAGVAAGSATAAATSAAAAPSASASAPAYGAPVPAGGAARDFSGDNAKPGATSSPVTNADVSPLITARQIISIANLTVEVPVVADAAKQVARIALEVGGRIDAQKIAARPDGGNDATIVVKVPPDRYDDAIAKLSAIGTRRALEQSTQDVTGNVTDLESRAATEAKSIQRIQAFMDKATSIKDIVILEGELTARESTRDSQLAQAKALRGQAAMGTITATYVEPNVIPPAKPKPTPPVHNAGFSAGLHNGWHAFTSTTVVLLTMLGAFAPFALPLGIVLALWMIARRRRRAATPVGPAPTERATT